MPTVKARDNPFRTERLHAIAYRPPDGSWEELAGRLAALRYRAAIVGPEGSGKTTLLEALAPRLEADGFRVRMVGGLSRSNRRLPRRRVAALFAGAGRCDVVLLDSADMLGPLAWRRFHRRTRRLGGLIVAAHRPGLLPTLIQCRTSPELLDAILDELLGPAAGAWRPAAHRLFAAHHGNVRTVLRGLYDAFAVEAGP